MPALAKCTEEIHSSFEGSVIEHVYPRPQLQLSNLMGIGIDLVRI